MNDLLIHLARVIYKLKEVSQEDKELLITLVKEKSKSSKFVPPTLEEVSDYLREQGYLRPQAYADQFVSFYGSKGWMVGKNKMKNWKLATKQWKEWEKKNNKLIV
jgi:hypothetical protein